MIFPVEIWERIFLYVDPVDLINLKIICKCWHMIIDRVLKENDHWHKKFIKEVPSIEWGTLYEKVCPDNNPEGCKSVGENSPIWMAMYRLWIICEKITKCRIRPESVDFVHRSPHITCATATENILAIGTEEGYIYFYKMTCLSKTPMYVADHMEHILDVQFLRSEKRIIAVSLSLNCHIKFWDIRLKALLDTTRGKLICTSYNNCYSTINNVLAVQGSVPKTQYEFHIHNFIAIAAENRKVSLYSANGDFVIWKKESQGENFTVGHVPLPSLSVRRCYIFKVNIAVCITELGFLGFSIAGAEWKIHNIFPIFHGIPTAVLIYVSVVIIGLDSGNILIFRVEDFDSLDFGTAECKTITLDTAPIESLDMTEYLGTVRLIAASFNAVHIINIL